jgi:flavoprotein hydroxylase
VICQADHKAAADRDAVMLGAQERGNAHPQTPLQALNNGFLRRGAKKAPIRPAGNLTPQGRVACGSHVGLFDDVVGLGFTLLSTVDPRTVLADDQLDFLVRLGTQLVHLAPAGTQPTLDRVVDVDNVYLPYLAETGSIALLVRPDFYVFGGAADHSELSAVVDDLRTQLDPAMAMS